MRKLLLLLFASIVYFNLQSQENVSHTSKTKVFLLAGQSNMDGRGDASKMTKQDKKRIEISSK
jgi:hypothetical protein